ncbi:unnamed protein product [Rhizoctonia solani]|uniref:Uncharacterized protein n=1 Tax=Rhizoctonia solani TaxID=456999 RepID=A0A8H2XPR7_9AGAM|nr:unnamed protein product [Rhizoctonia solani]
MSDAIYPAFAAILVLSVLLIRLVYSWLWPSPIPDIPHNPITSVWGDIPAITAATKDGGKTFSGYVADVVAEHGSLMQILIGRNPIVVISDRKEMERLLLGGKCTDQSKRTNEIFATVVPTGQIAQPTNDTWKRHRRLTGPSMSRRYLERMSSRIATGASDLVNLWKAKSEVVGLGTFDADLDLQLATMDAIDMIIEREAREGAEVLGKGELLDELLTYIFAGQDTTAASLAWLVKFLPKDVEIQRRLHNEVCAVFGPDMDSNEPMDFGLLDDHERVPVLEAVVAETLRCAGVGSLTGRELTQDETVSGRFVPKGTQLMFTTALMSSNKLEWGPDAEEWRPSRWLTPDGAFNRSAGPSVPFGLGQRSCFGQRLAVLQVKTFVATMSRTFCFKSVPPEVDVWGAVELVTRQPKACYVSLEKWDLKALNETL